MRVLRFLRPVRSPAAAARTSPADDLGLDAFAAEAAPAGPAPAPNKAERLIVAVIVLAALAVLEAVPAALWFYSWMKPVQPVTTVAAAPIAPPPLAVDAVLAAPPCTPAAGEQVAAAATAGTARSEVAPAVARPSTAGVVAGLAAITAPVPMHVYSNGRLVGTTDGEVLLPVGEHDLELVSEGTGFRTRRSVVIQAGRTSAVRIEPPRVPVHVNAIPWAEVWIDGQRIGETPIGNLQQTIGSHEVIFRHPELGERRMVVVVTMKEPARISMDMRKR